MRSTCVPAPWSAAHRQQALGGLIRKGVCAPGQAHIGLEAVGAARQLLDAQPVGRQRLPVSEKPSGKLHMRMCLFGCSHAPSLLGSAWVQAGMLQPFAGEALFQACSV